MSGTGISAMVRAGAWLDVQLGMEVLSLGRAGLARRDSCLLEISGRHLLYAIELDGGFIFLRALELDSSGPMDLLLTIGDTSENWQTVCQLIRALERHKITSLKRPIEAGTGPHGFVIG